MGRTAVIAGDRLAQLQAWAAELGFEAVGVSRADRLDEEAPRLEAWLAEGRHGEMGYMEGHFEKRLDPRLLLPGTKTVLSLLYNYHTPDPVGRIDEDTNLKISSYALGEDYHFVVKRKLKELLKWMRADWGDIAGRVFVDSAPVMERVWASRGGLGWIGKNSLLLTKGAGSYFFLGEILIDIELPASLDAAVDHCGTCTRCIDACPTGAIIQPYSVDGSRCISYYTIELRGDLPEPVAGAFEDWMFGCDICQEVCPWNRHAQPHAEPAFLASPDLLAMTRADWVDLTSDTFEALFKKSPIRRTGFEGLKRNIAHIERERLKGGK
jgi:epoxyqueuosine reductase